jgi:hypothetical protein
MILIDLIKSGIWHAWFYVDFIKKVLSLIFKYLKSVIYKAGAIPRRIGDRLVWVVR